MKQILIFVLGIYFSQLAWARGDNVENGGDAFAAEFVISAREVLASLSRWPDSSLKPISQGQLKEAIRTTTVQSEEKLKLRGREVDAINSPSKKLIRISRQRWKELQNEAFTISRLHLVLHEYLGVMGVDDGNYEVSERLIGLMSPSPTSTSRFWRPMNPTNFLQVQFETDNRLCVPDLIQFDLAKKTESFIRLIPCASSMRKIVVHKTEVEGTDVDQTIQGTFHVFEIVVLDQGDQEVGRLQYSPEFGRCLLALDLCYQSGWMKLGGVELQFSLTPDIVKRTGALLL